MRRNVASGGLAGLIVAALTGLAKAAGVMPPAPFSAAVTLTLLAISGAALWLRYSKRSKTLALEALVAELLAFIFASPPLYTLFLRVAGST